MNVISRKRTAAQREELQQFARMLKAVHQRNEQGLRALHPEVWELYTVCQEALLQYRDLEVGTLPLIVKATQQIRFCRDRLRDAQAELSSVRPSDWYPKKYRKAYDSWGTYLRAALVSLNTALDALESPEPLEHDPVRGNYALNDLVEGLSRLASVTESHLPIKL